MRKSLYTGALSRDPKEQLAQRAALIASFRPYPTTGARLPTDPAEQLAYRAKLMAKIKGTEGPVEERSRGREHTSTRQPRRPDSQHTIARVMVATRDFTTTYDGRPDHIKAGKSYIASDHPIVLRHPDAFKPAPPNRNGGIR